MVAALNGDDERLRALALENQQLRERIADLERKLAFLGQYRTLARGLTGERLVSRSIGGMLTAHTAPADVIVSDGSLIEVKFATISRLTKGYESGRRWQWQKIFGEKGGKVFDHMILVGEADPAFQLSYRDPKSPYVLFVIPYSALAELTTAGTKDARGILLLTNPSKARGRSCTLYSSYQRTIQEIEAQFGSLDLLPTATLALPE